MALDSTQKLRDGLVAFLAPLLDTISMATVDGFIARSLKTTIQVPADASATSTESVVLDTSTDLQDRVTAITLSASAAVALNAANYAIFTLAYDNGAGGASTTIATWNTSATSFVANQVFNVPSSAIVVGAIPAGSRITLAITKAGTGVQLPQSTIGVKFGPSA